MLKAELIDYHEYDEKGWYAFGLHFGVHSHGEPLHGHIWIELGRWCVEVTIGGRRYKEFMEKLDCENGGLENDEELKGLVRQLGRKIEDEKGE